jgi:hypothetical protein
LFTVIVWRDQAEHASQSSRRAAGWWSWTAEDGSARFTVEVLAEELRPSLRWATATPARIIKGTGR